MAHMGLMTIVNHLDYTVANALEVIFIEKYPGHGKNQKITLR
jgi:hypothetical protein